MFHFSLALVAHRRQQLSAIHRREMRADQTNRRQRGGAGPQCLEHVGNAPRETSRRNPAVGGVLGEVQHLRAIDKQRRTAFAEVQPPRIDLGEDLDHVRCRGALRHDGTPQLDQQLIVRKAREGGACICHVPL
jgi:hypothetical protein